jgi:PAS domain-containing protein
MNQAQGPGILFDLFESSGIGLIGFDAEDRIHQLNANAGRYLGIEPERLLGGGVAALRPHLRSVEFWDAFPGTFYCLAPGADTLLLMVCRTLRPEGGSPLRRAIILRPYSLEREFSRMRVCLNNYLAHEIASHLNSIGIASEFITEPELRQNPQTRDAFITTFRQDITDLNDLFVQLMETAEPIAMPNRLAPGRIDWKALVEDQAAKIRGLASEKSISLSCPMPPHLPTARGDYHWLSLGLFGVFAHLFATAPPLSEISISAGHADGVIATTITNRAGEGDDGAVWPPRMLFPLDEANPRIARMEITDLAVSRGIFLLHGGDLLREESAGQVVYRMLLPA